jgi:hypothetical protein
MNFQDDIIYTYFKRRDDSFYYDYTKEEVNNMIAKDGEDAFIYFCK